MLEKDIENLIAQHPQEFFPKEELTLKGQQVRISGRILDILFEDKHGRLIVVEVKRGILGREAAGQIIEYYGLLKQAYPGKVVELVLCANVIPKERSLFLENTGIECVELGLHKILEIAKQYGYKFLDDEKEKVVEQARPLVSTPEELKRRESLAQNVWIFQANPNRYDILNALSDDDFGKNMWLVSQHKSEIKKSDLALIWMSGSDAGIYAIAEILSNPMFMIDDPKQAKYWAEEEDRGKRRLRVEIKIVMELMNRPLLRREIREIEGLKNLSILKFSQGTNFPVTAAEWHSLKEIFLKQS